MAALTACVTSAKYDRALGVMSKYQVDRMRAESERDVAIAGMNEQLAKQNGELASTKDAARALTVTKFMIEQGIKPKTIAAAGYGEWDPVGNNKTDKGRQSNRRIEIILLPNIAELPKLPAMEEGGTP